VKSTERQTAPRRYVVATRVRDPERRRTRLRAIVDAAVELFAERGFDATPVGEIADRADMTVGAMYKYVRSKHDILYLVLEDLTDQIEAVLEEWADSTAEPREAFVSALDAYFRLCARNGRVVMIGYREAHHLEPPARAYVLQMELRLRTVLARLMGRAAGIAENDKVINTVINNVILLAHQWAVSHPVYASYLSLDEFVQLQIELALKQVSLSEASDGTGAGRVYSTAPGRGRSTSGSRARAAAAPRTRSA
jgi:AcrR family transcriptional regulator